MTSKATAEERVCWVVRKGAEHGGHYGASYTLGVTAETVGARGLSLSAATLPPGGRTRAHVHEHESAFYVMSGEGDLYSGERMERREHVRAGDFFYVTDGVAHIFVNTSRAEPAVFVGGRTDPNMQEAFTPRPDLDPLVSVDAP